MDLLEKSIYITALFDIYQNLLTDKQKVYMRDYYYDNLSLHEIAENHGVSRNAIHDQIKKTIQKLESYEEALELYAKQIKQVKIYEQLDEMNLSKEIRRLIEELKKVE
jgi:predicted DNA-binding protein YlxM (UPF0122 family)